MLGYRFFFLFFFNDFHNDLMLGHLSTSFYFALFVFFLLFLDYESSD